MTQINDREWVQNALKFWLTVKPNRIATRKIIKWNIEILTQALARIK
jgi:hypothetical protein